MSGGLFALFDDVAALAKVAAASMDDVAAGAGRASAKAAGVVVDDTAVTPQFMTGSPTERELPIIKKIALGSLRNKILFILPAALVPMAGTQIENGILMAGGYCYRFELPDGAEARERRFHAIAWPMAAAAGHKIFCVNQDEDILESPNPENFVGCDRAPPPGTCPAPDTAGSSWTRWRGKTSQLRVGYVD